MRKEASFTKRENLHVLDLMPEKMGSEVPVLFAPGWSNSPETLRPSLDVLVENGLRTISFAHSRKSELLESPEGVSKEELQKALTIIGILEEKGIEKTDLVGYSEGGINGLIAASLFPEKFRNIVLVDPAGMVGKNSLLSLPVNMTKELCGSVAAAIRDKKFRQPVVSVAKDILTHIRKNPMMSFREVHEISQAEVLEMMQELRKKSVGISVISGTDDKVFPMDEIQKNLKKESVDGFYSVSGGHAEIILHPQQYMGLVAEALRALEAKSKKCE